MLGAAGLAIVSIALVVLIVYSTKLLYVGADAPPVNHVAQYNELALRSAGVQEGENTWGRFIDILQLLEETDRELQPANAGDGWSVPYSEALAPGAGPNDVLLAHRGLEELERRGVFERLDELAANPQAARLFANDGETMFDLADAMPSLSASRNLARALVLRMQLALRAGDGQESIRTLRHALTLSTVIGQQPTIVDCMVSIAISFLVEASLREEILMDRPEADVLRAMIAEFERHPGPPLAMIFEGERIMGQDLLYTTLSPNSPLRPLNRGAQMVRHNRFYDALSTYIAAPRPERSAALASELDAYMDPGWSYAPLAAILPAVRRIIDVHDMQIAIRGGTMLMLAVEAHIAEEGIPPGATGELSPGYLAAIPPDPFSASGYRYRVLDAAADPAGRSYLLYSVGADGSDDGGQRAAPPVDALNGRGPGTDFVFNAPPDGDAD